MNKKEIITYVILSLHILALILYHVFGYIGHYGFDDMHYARLAIDMTNGIINFDDHFTFRLPLVMVTALSYSIFGVSDFASAFPSFLVTICILLLVFNTLKGKNNLTLLLGLSLTLFSNWFIFYADKIMPDIYVALSVLLFLFILHKYKFQINQKHTLRHAILSALALLFGFMAKGTIILVLPLLTLFIIIDFIKKRDIRFWLYFIVSGVFFLCMYFLLTWKLSGDFLKRFEAISQSTYLNLCSYDQQPIMFLYRRISYEFWFLLIYQGMLISYIFIIPVLFKNRFSNFLQQNDTFSFYSFSSIILLLSSNFMTISATSYSPMCLDPRHYLFLIPVAAIPASLIIEDFVKEKSNGILLIICLFIISILSFFLEGNSFWALYMPLTVLFSLYYFVKKDFQYKAQYFAVLFVIILLLKPFIMIKYAQEIKYDEQKEILFEQILNKDENSYVISNYAQKELGNYYKEFDGNVNTTFLSYDKFNFDTLDDRRKLLFLNWYTRYLSIYDEIDLPYYAKNVHSLNKLIYENQELEIAIYELNEFYLPSNKDGKIYTINNFEKDIDNWSQNNHDITDTIQFEGNKSYKVKEYSATFIYPIDSLPLDSSNNLIIACKLYCYFSDKTKSKLVISVENSEGEYIWEGLDINKYLKAHSNWWPVQFDIKLSNNELKEKSRIKVYLWNTDKIEAYIDNFEVYIIETEK